MNGIRSPPIFTENASTRASSRRSRRLLTLLELPGEILSHIASYLDYHEIFPFLSLNSILLNLSRTHLSPLHHLIRQTLESPLPYPSVFAKLPSLTLFLPDDGGLIFLDVLVRARPKWILERLEIGGRWKEEVWKEAYERRFLTSWRRYKLEEDTWRAAFIRMLGKLEHRNLGCTHEESWTRFITLSRNGSASINRIYSRLFDPYQIYDELKQQNNFASEPTTVRVIVHLQDVRIIALGVLYQHPSLFVNQNAHEVLHPPLLYKSLIPQNDEVDEMQTSRRVSEEVDRKGKHKMKHRASEPVIIRNTENRSNRSGSLSTNLHVNNEAYYPLVRSLSPSGAGNTSYGLGEGSSNTSNTASQPAQSTSGRRATLSFFPGNRRRQSSNATQQTPGAIVIANMQHAAEASSYFSQSAKNVGAMLTKQRSRDSDEGGSSSSRKRWSLGNIGSNRRGSGGSGSSDGKSGPKIPASALFGETTYNPDNKSSSALDVASSIGGGGGGGSSSSGLNAGSRKIIPAGALFTDYSATSTRPRSILANPTGKSSSRPITPVQIIQPTFVRRSETPSHHRGRSPPPPPASAQEDEEEDTGKLEDIASPPPVPIIQFPPTPPISPITASHKISNARLPYPPLRKPAPVQQYKLYPNHTPASPISFPPNLSHPKKRIRQVQNENGDIEEIFVDDEEGERENERLRNELVLSRLYDKRSEHQEIEDDHTGTIWSGSKVVDDEWGMGGRKVEWDDVEQTRKRWVGPMIIVAQLHPSYINQAQPAGVDSSFPTEGSNPELGPKGMYVSIGFEDISTLMPWLELKGGGAYVSDPRRGGMGFDNADDGA